MSTETRAGSWCLLLLRDKEKSHTHGGRKIRLNAKDNLSVEIFNTKQALSPSGQSVISDTKAQIFSNDLLWVPLVNLEVSLPDSEELKFMSAAVGSSSVSVSLFPLILLQVHNAKSICMPVASTRTAQLCATSRR